MHPKISRLHPPFELSCNCIKNGVKGDLVLVKSISRFARNTVDCLNYIRALRTMGIAVIFEKKDLLTAKVPKHCGISALFCGDWCLVGV